MHSPRQLVAAPSSSPDVLSHIQQRQLPDLLQQLVQARPLGLAELPGLLIHHFHPGSLLGTLGLLCRLADFSDQVRLDPVGAAVGSLCVRSVVWRIPDDLQLDSLGVAAGALHQDSHLQSTTVFTFLTVLCPFPPLR